MKNNVIGVIVLIVLVVLGAWYFTQSPNESEKNSYTNESFTFAENGTELIVTYTESGDRALLSINGNEYELDRVMSASGARYTNDDESVVFWEHQGEAMVEVNGETIVADARQAGTDNPMFSSNNLDGTMWEWQETQYGDGSMVTPAEENIFILSFMDKNRFSASTDCNSLMGTYNADEVTGSILLSDISSTKMACPFSENQEIEFTEMLNQSTGYLITDNGRLALTLRYDSGSVLFTPVKMHDEIIGMTEDEAAAYAEINKLPFRIGTIDGEGRPVTADFRPGRITAELEGGVVTGYTVE
jgi:heat shock protein HslJ